MRNTNFWYSRGKKISILRFGNAAGLLGFRISRGKVYRFTIDSRVIVKSCCREMYEEMKATIPADEKDRDTIVRAIDETSSDFLTYDVPQLETFYK